MPVVNAVVLLTAYRQGDEQLNLTQTAPWYVQYFFNPDYGHKAHWLKQTDNDLILDGEVSDWAFYPQGSLNLASRGAVAQTAVDTMGRERGINFSRFDMVIVVLGIAKGIDSDGGSTEVTVEGRRIRAVVGRIGDRFDFMSHEIGHGLGLSHSFGSVHFQTAGERAGGYGHPHCIMSAMSYGFMDGGNAYFPNAPREGRVEYSALGPSLNAVTALGRGWVNAHAFKISEMGPTEFQIRSRHYGGRNAGLAPQAIEVLTPSGDNYVIEYREKAGWDRGQDCDYLIVAQGRGAIGEAAYPGAFVGTYLARVALPVTLGAPGHFRNFPGFGLQLLDRSAEDHTLKLKLFPGPAPIPDLTTKSKVETLERDVLERGETTWAPGEKLCVEGTFAFEKVSQRQRATFEASCGAAEPKISAAWTIDGQLVPLGSPWSLVKDVQVANPKLMAQIETHAVTVECQVEELPNGSRLHVTSAPTNETFHLDVRVVLSSTIGSTSQDFAEELAGIVYDYGEEFEAKRLRCMLDLSDPNRHFPTYEVLVEQEGWEIPLERRVELERYLGVLAQLKSSGDVRFDRTAAELSRVVLARDVPLKVVARDGALRLTLTDPIHHPPGPARPQDR